MESPSINAWVHHQGTATIWALMTVVIAKFFASHVAPTYGATAQYIESETLSMLLNKVGQKYVQAVTKTLFYYSHTVDSTMLVA